MCLPSSFHHSESSYICFKNTILGFSLYLVEGTGKSMFLPFLGAEVHPTGFDACPCAGNYNDVRTAACPGTKSEMVISENNVLE